MNQNKKNQKKKDREKKVRNKVLRRRETLRRERKEEKLKELALEKEYELVNGKPDPIITDPAKLIERNKKKVESAKKQLEHNMKILEALEGQYLEETQMKSQLNKELESEGHSTMKEKLQALHEKVRQRTEK